MTSPARLRMRASLVVARRQIRETMLGPGIYVVLAVALLSAHWLVTAFAASIDAGGFDPERTALYRLLYDASVAAFGQTFFDGMVAEGPFVLAFTVSMGTVVVYLAASSVSRLALERRVGAMELVSYGPADATSSLLGALTRDVALSVASALLLLGVFTILAARHNLAMGPRLAYCVLAMAGLGLALSSMGIFCAAAASRTGSAVALFVSLLLLFLALLVARYAAVGGYLRSLTATLSAALRWVSPLGYWDLAMASAGSAHPGLASIALLGLPVLSSAYLFAGHLLAGPRGSRP